MAYSPKRETAPNTRCQCCGRPVAALTGMIAQHGFTRDRVRPGLERRTEPCPGSRYLPVEVSRDRMPEMIARYSQWLSQTLDMIDELDAGKLPVRKVFTWKPEREPGQRGPGKTVTETIFITEKNIVEMILTWPQAEIGSYAAEAASYRADLNVEADRLERTMHDLADRYRSWEPHAEIAQAWQTVFGDNLFNPPMETNETDGLPADIAGYDDPEGYINISLTRFPVSEWKGLDVKVWLPSPLDAPEPPKPTVPPKSPKKAKEAIKAEAANLDYAKTASSFHPKSYYYVEDHLAAVYCPVPDARWVMISLEGDDDERVLEWHRTKAEAEASAVSVGLFDEWARPYTQKLVRGDRVEAEQARLYAKREAEFDARLEAEGQ